jgi:hypothetical protein
MALTKVRNQMIDGSVVNVVDFGAVGDGVNDDTSAIQAAIDSVVNTGGEVLIPAGIYKVTSTIYIESSSTTVRGENASTGSFFIGAVDVDGTTLDYQGSGNEPVLAMGLEDESANRSGILVTNLRILGNMTTGVYGLQVLRGVINSKCENLFITRCDRGIHLRGEGAVQSFNNRFYNCHVEHFAEFGIDIEEDGNGTIISGCKFANSSTLGASPTASVRIGFATKANMCTIENCSFGSQNILHHIKVYDADGIMISGNEIEASGNSTINADALVHLGDAGTSSTVTGFSIIGNRFLGNSKSDRPISVSDDAEGGVICGNSFGSSSWLQSSVISTNATEGNYDISIFGNYLPSGTSIVTNRQSVNLLYNEDLAQYNPTNVSTTRTFDADSTTIAEVADVLGTLINDLQNKRILDDNV